MSLFKEMVDADIGQTFFNEDEFAEKRIINRHEMKIVPDEHALEKYNLKAEGEGLAEGELLFYVSVSAFEKKPFVGMPVAIDDRDYEVLNYSELSGVYKIVVMGYHA